MFKKVYSDITKNPNNNIFNPNQEKSSNEGNDISSQDDKNINSHENKFTSNTD